jgi:hypothetical protein
MRRSLSAVGGIRTASRASQALAEAIGEGAAFAEFLKSTKLGNVETCILHAALVVQVQRDLGMSLDASYGIDQNRLAGLLLPRG